MTFRFYRILAWIAVFLIALEIALEARAHARGWPTVIFGDNAPPAEVEASSYGPTDDFPFRSRIYAHDAAPGTRRIWLGSSSYAEDVRQPVDKLFLVLAEDRLRDDGHAVEMFNNSQGGASTVNNIRDLINDTRQYDIAVLYQMTNDIDALTEFVFGPDSDSDIVDEDFRTAFALSHDEGGRATVAPATQEQAAPEPPINDRVMTSVQSFFEKTSTYAQLKNQITSRLTRSRVLAERLGDEGNALFIERVEAFLDACLERGIQPVLCTFATSHTPASINAMPADSINNLFRYNIHLSVKGWMTSVAEINTAIRALANERGVPLIDIGSVITGRTEYFRDFTHLTREGHAAVAAELASGLEEVLAR